MNALLKRIEVESPGRRDDDFAVEDATSGQQCRELLVQFRKIPVEWMQVAALNEHVRRTAKDERAKAVPLRFVQKVAARNAIDRLCEHRLDRRLDSKTIAHGSIVIDPDLDYRLFSVPIGGTVVAPGGHGNCGAVVVAP